MGKAPAFQFYYKDWLTDTRLRLCSISTRGIWIDLLGYMWDAPDRGELIITPSQITKITGCNGDETSLFLLEAETYRFCDISVTNNEKILLRNRRMFREDKSKKNNRVRQQTFRDKHKSNIEITPPSPSPSPSPRQKHTSSDDEVKEFYRTKKKKKLIGQKLLWFNQFWDAFNYKYGKAEAADAWLEIPDLNLALVEKIIQVAEKEALIRPGIEAKGKTPKMAEGWINGRRWEDEGVKADTGWHY